MIRRAVRRPENPAREEMGVRCRILLVLDGGADGERIVPWVRDLSRAGRIAVHLLMVRTSPPERAEEAGAAAVIADCLDEIEAAAYLTAIAADLRDAGLSVEIEVRFGEADEAIAGASRRIGADLIALGLPPAGVLRLLRPGRRAKVLALTGLPVLVVGYRAATAS